MEMRSILRMRHRHTATASSSVAAVVAAEARVRGRVEQAVPSNRVAMMAGRRKPNRAAEKVSQAAINHVRRAARADWRINCEPGRKVGLFFLRPAPESATIVAVYTVFQVFSWH